jgi:hypothetical protein
MVDDLRHNMNLIIPGLNFWGDQDDAAKSVVDKTKWVMQTAIARIEKLEAENAELQSKINTVRLAAKYAAKIRDGRIEKLEAALAHIYAWYPVSVSDPAQTIKDIREFARKALEVKDD